MSSNVNSSGVPIDHDGEALEFGVMGNVAPFAVSGDVFRELFGGCVQGEGSHLESNPVGGVQPYLSSSGGIPVEQVDIEDITDAQSDSEPPSPRTAQEMCRSDNSSTIHAVLRTSKHEREELFRARNKLNTVLSFLRKQGFSEEQILEDIKSEGLGGQLPVRDDYDLPILSKKDPFKDKMKGKVDSSQGPEGEDKMFVNNPEKILGTSQMSVKGKEEGVKPSWSSVVAKGDGEEKLCFDYSPLPAGCSVVTPPSDVLKKGLEKFKYCIVGVFTKGTLPLSKLEENVRKAWLGKGLLHSSQKDSHTFMFKFSSEMGMNSVLARGTWYFERKPLLLSAWGTDLFSKGPSTIPLWVRFKNLPDYYWTQEGLSYVASAIGPPICADKVTAQLNPVQFAKMCVRYKVGDALPETIRVALMDAHSLEFSKDAFVDIEVSYPQRPMVCSGCSSLGHMVGACPLVKRVWVQKKSKEPTQEVQSNPVEGSTGESVGGSKMQTQDGSPPLEQLGGSVVQVDSQNLGVQENKTSSDEGWKTVGRKKSSPKEKNAENTSKAADMPIFTAIAKSMTKGQLKRARKAGGLGPHMKT